jgi:hypothetical protein
MSHVVPAFLYLAAACLAAATAAKAAPKNPSADRPQKASAVARAHSAKGREPSASAMRAPAGIMASEILAPGLTRDRYSVPQPVYYPPQPVYEPRSDVSTW